MTVRFTRHRPSLVASGPRTGRDHSQSQRVRAFALRSGFTLIEMVVVIGIILLIAAMVVPSTTALWNERKMSEVINTAKGVFMTSRVRAMDSGGAESGFFVFVDDRGNQRITAIEQPADKLADPAWQNVFVITADLRDQILPRPIRVVPRYVAEDPTGTPTYRFFDEEELANNSFDSPPVDLAQRHRNFFSVIFSTSGELIVDRDVLILDEDKDLPNEPGYGLGDRTGLSVGPGAPPGGSPPPTTDQYYDRNSSNTALNIGAQIEFLVVDRLRDPPTQPAPTDVAINFPSVDGLLVYDDALFNDLPDPATKRQFLLDTATPLYVGRYTGMVIRGPVGEN